MKHTFTQWRSFPPAVQLLMVNQFTINVGFYMLMPYLATHLAGDLGLAVWLVGLVLGVRNLTQQSMFLIGGSLADRFGYKPMIIAGCALRTVGFALLGLVDSLPALVAASAATGFAGALFNPAVRAYLAQDAGQRRVEAFALFNVFYQAGILLGPLIGLVLTGITFSLTCLVAAAIFAALTVVQTRALPARKPTPEPAAHRPSVLRSWRTVIGNRQFLLFSAAMIGSYVLSFQMYLALPLQVRRLAASDLAGTTAVGALFAVSGALAITGQLWITTWCKHRWKPGQCLCAGLTLMAAAFVAPLIACLWWPRQPDTSLIGQLLAFTPLIVSTVLLTLGTLIVYPFEMDTVISLSGGHLVATHYGLYNTICGIGITLGNLLTGSTLDFARSAGMPALPWLTLILLGIACAGAIHLLHRTGRLQPKTHKPTPAQAQS